MKLVFVHGRRQGKKNADVLREEWLQGLRKGFERNGLDPGAIPSPAVPFYGAELDRLTAGPRVIAHGGGGDSEFLAFEAEVVTQMAKRAAAQGEPIEGARVVAHGIGLPSWVNDIGAKVTGRFPWLQDESIERFTEDVWAYLTRVDIRTSIDTIVRTAIPTKPEPCVVVAHSLGTVVTYNVLAATANLDVRLLVTVGSPLGLRRIRERSAQPLGPPAGIAHWLNASDENDLVALHPRLDRTCGWRRIENFSDIENGDDPHSIQGYLSDVEVAGRIARALEVSGAD